MDRESERDLTNKNCRRVSDGFMYPAYIVKEYHFWCLHVWNVNGGVQGDSKFVYDVDTVHNLSVTFRVRGFVTSSSTVMQAAQSMTESSSRSDKEGRIRVVETVNFFPEIMSGELRVTVRLPYFLLRILFVIVDHVFACTMQRDLFAVIIRSMILHV